MKSKQALLKVPVRISPVANNPNDRQQVWGSPTVDRDMNFGTTGTQNGSELVFCIVESIQRPGSDGVERVWDSICDCRVVIEQCAEICRLDKVEGNEADNKEFDEFPFEGSDIGARGEQVTIESRLTRTNGGETVISCESMQFLQVPLDMTCRTESVALYHVTFAQTIAPLFNPVLLDLIANMPDPRRLSSAIVFAEGDNIEMSGMGAGEIRRD